jgi:hypothetical protein
MVPDPRCTVLKLYTPGTEVMLGDIPCAVLTVQISDICLAVKYLLVYWIAKERKEVWVSDFEITGPADKRIPFGFHPQVTHGPRH